MGWVKVSDDYPDHPKLDSLSDGAFRLDVSGWCYAARHLTDGVIPAGRVSRLTPRYKPAHVAELVKVGRWHPDGHDCGRCPQPGPDGYTIHDYLDFNPSAERVNKERDEARTRMRTHRARSGEQPANVRPNFGVGSATPSRPVTNTSSSDLRGDRATPDDDVLAAACRRLAETEADHHDDIGNRPAWVRSRAANLRREHEPEAQRVLAQHPDLDPPTLARYLAGEHAVLDPDRRWLPGTGWVEAV